MRQHPLDILGLVPSLSYTKEDVSRAKRAANLRLSQNGERHCCHRDGVEFVYTATKVNNSADNLIKVIEADGLVFCLVEWGEYTSNWNPQAPDRWDQPIPGWEARWRACYTTILRFQREAVSWETERGEYKLRQLRAEFEQEIKHLDEDAAKARQNEDAAEEGLVRAVADLEEERNKHQETIRKLKLLESRQHAEYASLEEEREDFNRQIDQFEAEQDHLSRDKQQYQADLDQLQHEREAFDLLQQQHQADRDQLRREREAFDLQQRQLEGERDRNTLRQTSLTRSNSGGEIAVQSGSRRELKQKYTGLLARKLRLQRQAGRLESQRTALLQNLGLAGLEMQRKEDEAEREARFLDDMEAKIAHLSSDRDEVDNDYATWSPLEDDLVSHSDLQPCERSVPSQEPFAQEASSRSHPSRSPPFHTPSPIPATSQTPPPSRSPPSTPGLSEAPHLPRLELGKAKDGRTVWGGVDKRGRIFRRANGSQGRKTNFRHAEIIYHATLANKTQEEVERIIRLQIDNP
jgi:hypothetical protein